MSKLGKFRHDPQGFFRDSKSRLVSGVGQVLAPFLATDVVRDLLLEPTEVLARTPIVGLAARELRESLSRRRLATLARLGNPLVSIVMPAHNAEETIANSIESILEQTYSNVEVIIVDDASTDGTVELVRSIDDERISVHATTANRGAAHARNIGIDFAQGDALTFHDADDRSHPERLERQLAGLLTSGAIVSVCASQREDDAGRPVRINGKRVRKTLITMMFRRAEVLERVGFMRELHVSEDSEYFERIKAAFPGRSESFLAARLYTQRFSADSLMFSDGEVSRAGDGVVHQRSEQAEIDWRESRERIERIRRGQESPYVARAT